MKKVDEGDLAPPSSRDDERIDSPWTNENSSPDAVRNSKLVGSGRLVPAQATGIEYTVKFEIKVPPAGPQYGRVVKPTRWAKCLVRTAQMRLFSDGNYFLHTDEGRVLQLKMIGGMWHCLALAL
jgi:hypothetical protein